MTRDEAISIMNVIVHMLEPQYDTDRIEEAVEMAIKALDQQPTDAVDRVTIKEYLESFGNIKTEQEPCDDCISRSAVLAIAGDSCLDLDSYEDTREFCDEIKELPPVTPQQKWILCKDRMPDYHQLVLTSDGEYICVEQRIPYIIGENGKHIESEWWVDVNYVPDSELYSGLRDGAAVAWMPLPLPYKQEVEG